MLSLFRIRQELDAIDRQELPPAGKARRILRLAQRIESSAARTARLSNWYFAHGEGVLGARFRSAMCCLMDLHFQARERARQALGNPAVTPRPEPGRILLEVRH